MGQTKSSKKWLKEHFDDIYVKKSKEQGYRGRAVYKLIEVDEKDNLIKSGMSIVDLGAAPGSWSQYASKKLNGKGQIFALDILPMDGIEDVCFLQGDFRESEVLDKLSLKLKGEKVDLILSDMAPNMSGNTAIDMPRAYYLAEMAYCFAEENLKSGGNLFIKLFHGEGFDTFVKKIKESFSSVKVRKPKCSRPRSRETYLLAKGYIK